MGDSDNPYQSATDSNTSKQWLADEKPVDVNLHGMADFAKNLAVICDNLHGHRQIVLRQMQSVIEDGAFAGGFPEINYAARIHGRNLGEFTTYLNKLWEAIQHTASAAQVIADAYAGNDERAAVSLDAVKFAYGDRNAKRPAGLPSVYGQTYLDRQLEQQAKAGAGHSKGHADSVWTQTNTWTDANGATVTIYNDQYGDTKRVSVLRKDGETITTITTPDGTTTISERTVSYPYGSVTTRTTTTPDGKTSTSTVSRSWDYDSDTTVYHNSKGEVTSSTTNVYHDGERTETTYSYDDKGEAVTASQVTYGPEHYGSGIVDDPGVEAEQELRDEISQESDTTVLAPGELGTSYSPGSGTSV